MKQTIFVFIAFVLIFPLRMIGQKSDIEVRRARRAIILSINVTNSSRNTMIIPTCGDMDGTPKLCYLAVEMEIQSPSGWKMVQSKCDCSIPGVGPLSHGISLAPGERSTFVFEFDIRHVDVEAGQRMHLVLETFLNYRALMDEHDPQKLTSSPFDCP